MDTNFTRIYTNKKIVAVSVAIIICVAIFGYFYASLSGELNRKASEYKALESQLEGARMIKMRIIHKFRETGLDSEFVNRVLAKSDLPQVLNGFMKVGKECGVSLPSISPHEPQYVPGLSDVVKIPVTIEAESRCRNLGEFLNNLIKELRTAMAQVDTIEIKKAGGGEKLEAVIGLSMYVKK